LTDQWEEGFKHLEEYVQREGHSMRLTRKNDGKKVRNIREERGKVGEAPSLFLAEQKGATPRPAGTRQELCYQKFCNDRRYFPSFMTLMWIWPRGYKPEAALLWGSAASRGV
jgi:hypothetical protein